MCQNNTLTAGGFGKMTLRPDSNENKRAEEQTFIQAERKTFENLHTGFRFILQIADRREGGDKKDNLQENP